MPAPPLSDLHGQAAQHVADACAGRARPRVLDAGCGARSHIALPPAARVVGLDVSRTQLGRNASAAFRVEGDVSALPLADDSVDAAVSWDVLEHVHDPARVVAELQRVVRPDGVIVIAVPHVLSLKGVVTRATPWWVHVWVYRRVLGDASVGTDTSDQFPTTLRLVLRPAGLRRLARTLALEVLMLDAYEGPVPQHFRRRHPWGGALLGAIGAATRLLTGGRYDAAASDLIAVLRVPARAGSV